MGKDVISETVLVEVSFFALRARERVFSGVLLKMPPVSSPCRKFSFAVDAFVVLLKCNYKFTTVEFN